MRYAIGVDFGTKSGRVMLVSLDNGEEAAWEVVAYPNGVLERALPSGVELGADFALQDPRDYLEVLRAGIPAVLKKAGAKANDVVGVGTDFTACTMLPVLEDGTPLCTLAEFANEPHAWVKLWKHHAAEPQAKRIEQTAAEAEPSALAHYNGKYSSEWFFSKLLETVEKAPGVYRRADRFVEAGDWITWRMTGQLRANECCAGYKDMWVKGRGFASDKFFTSLNPELAGVKAKLESQFYPLGSAAGGLTPGMASMTGLRAGTPVAVGCIDAHAGVPGCGVVDAGVLVMIMGTSLCHMLLARAGRVVEGVAGVVEDGILPGCWGYEAGQAAVGDLYAWFFRTFQADPDRVTEQAAQLRPGQSGLVALDWWNGNRSVLMDAGLSGLLVGATLQTTPAEIYRALIEATAFGTLTIIEAFEREGIAIDRLVACGGLPQKSPLVMRIFADVTKREIHLPRSLQASGLGAAIHGAVAAGAYPDFAQAVARMAGGLAGSYKPDAEAHAVYRRLYGHYGELHDRFGRGGSSVMHELRRMKTS